MNFRTFKIIMLKILNADLVTCFGKLLLCPMTIYETPLYSFLYTTIFLSFGAFSILGSIIGFSNTTGLVNTLEAFISVTSQINGTVLFLIVFNSRKKLIRLFAKLEKKHENIDAIPSRASVFIKINLIWFAVALGISSTIILTSSFALYFVDENISDKHSLLLPFWYSCGDPRLNRWFCWRTSTKNDLLVKNGVLFVISSMQVFAYISTFTLFGIVVGELGMHLENIGKRVDRFIKDADNVEKILEEENARCSSGSELIAQNEEEFYQQFIQIIKHQQFLYSCIVLAVDMWKTYVSYYYTSGFIDVTALLFIADMERRNEKLLAFRAGTLCQMRLLMGFIVAHCSQNISHLNEDFANQLARLRWYERNRKFQKTYLQLVSFHQKTNVMKIYGIVVLNFNYYARMVKNIYSFVNLMILRYGK